MNDATIIPFSFSDFNSISFLFLLSHSHCLLAKFTNFQQFERYFAANDVKKQGSFYLQSKIYRAHELLMEFQAEKHKEDVNGGK